jgi:hypothetical protein
MLILLRTGVQVFDIGSRSKIVERERLSGGLDRDPEQGNDCDAKNVL